MFKGKYLKTITTEARHSPSNSWCELVNYQLLTEIVFFTHSFFIDLFIHKFTQFFIHSFRHSSNECFERLKPHQTYLRNSGYVPPPKLHLILSTALWHHEP